MQTPTILQPAGADLQQQIRQLRRRRVRSLVLRISMAAGAVIGALAIAWPWYRFSFSLTDSLPDHFYLIRVGTLPSRIGQYVAFYPPDNRFYPHHTGFLKRVRGMAGDIITRQGRRFYVDGIYVGTAKTRSLGGLPLSPGPVGTLPLDTYWVWTPDTDSYDSRYADIGWIPADHVVGTAIPLF
jgi:Type IV secretory pathway, protease TraF